MEESANTPTSTQEFCLRWNNFHASLVSAFDGFKNDSDFVDVTLACEGQFIKAHKMLLSACSAFFRDLLKANPCQHPIVILPPEVKFLDLERLMRFIYQGEVNVLQDHLPRFLKTAEMLKIRGLAEEKEKKKILECPSPKNCDSGSERSSDNVSVIPKRPRLSTDGVSGSSLLPGGGGGDLHLHPHQQQRPRTPATVGEDGGSGPESDSEMIPVKQEMIEFKECDFESVECESFFSDGFIKINSSIAASSSCGAAPDNTATSTHQVAPPPPPGALLPSYVPPMQIKAPDECSQSYAKEEFYSGTTVTLSSKSSDISRDENVPKIKNIDNFDTSTPKSSHPTTGRRIMLPRNTNAINKNSVSASLKLSTNIPTPSSPKPPCSSPLPPLSKGSDSRRSTGEGVSPNPNLSSYAYSSSCTGSSRSIWHPPISSTPTEKSPQNLNEGVPLPSLVTSMHTPLTCDICDKTFTSRSNLNKHKRVQHSGEEYICPICKRSFKNRYYIKDHVHICAQHNMRSPSNPSQSPIECSPQYLALMESDSSGYEQDSPKGLEPVTASPKDLSRRSDTLIQQIPHRYTKTSSAPDIMAYVKKDNEK